MQGIVFNLLEEVITRSHGVEAWYQMNGVAGITASYQPHAGYDDGELIRLVEAAASVLSMPKREVLRWFGRSAIPLLAERYRGFFLGHADTRAFLLTLNDIIHPEVRRLYPSAAPPRFDFKSVPDGSLRLGYRSERKLCALAEGFILGAADHYRQTVSIDHSICMHRGDNRCLLILHFSPMQEP